MMPRERICAAIRGEETDYLPCSIYFNTNLKVEGYDCARLTDRTDLALELGVDPFVPVGLSSAIHPDVKMTHWEAHVAGERYPILWQQWDTPVGKLTQAVRRDEGCRAWKTIHWNDQAASSLYQPLIQRREDVDAFRYVTQPATEADYERWLAANRGALELAAEKDLPVVATYGQGLARLMFTMGAEAAVYFAMDEPEAFEELAEIIHQAEMRNIELAARGKVDILKRFGGYEMCNFYNPDIYHRVCLPRLKKEVAYAHSLGLLIYYRIVTGMEPLLNAIASIGFDCIEGGEPHLSQCSLEMWRDAFSEQAASWTGISTPVLIGGDDEDAVRQEVRHCVDVFGKRRFVLGVTNSIRSHFPWHNALAMIDEWKKIRSEAG